MADVYHEFGGDLVLSANGDLLTAQDSQEGRQRVLRRLATNLVDYIWHTEYGAGLPAQVGGLVDIPKIKGIVRTQIFLESRVSETPDPVITVEPITEGVNVTIQYTDKPTGQVQTLSFSVNK